MARLDDEDLRNRLEVARATLVSARARLDKLLAGSRPEEIRQAEAAVQQAQFDLENKQITYERMKLLYEKQVIAKESYDNAETAFKVAKAALQRAKENYQLVKEGPRKEDIDDARAQVEQARASLKLAETQLGYSVLYSPLSGVILVKSGEIGEVVNPGTPILTVADIRECVVEGVYPGDRSWQSEMGSGGDRHHRPPSQEGISREKFPSSPPRLNSHPRIFKRKKRG